MPVRSWQMATAPLSDEARKTVIPGRQAMSDTHGELYFARYDARNRLVTGGAMMGTDTAAAQGRGRRAPAKDCGRRSARSNSTMSGTAMSA